MSTNAESTETGSSIKQLESSNYHQWSDLMQSYFLEHNLDGIVEGTEPQPISSPTESQNWLLRQKKAAGFIARKLDARNRDLFITSLNRRDPQALWAAIELEYASKKARNRSRLFTRFLSLNCSDGNLLKYTSSFREIIREMNNAGVMLDDDLLAHMALHHLPVEYQTTRQVIITSAESSDTALTVNGVLSQINELIKDGESTKTTATALNTKTKFNNNRFPVYERCLNGTHNIKTAHAAEDCWQLHPEKNPRPPQRFGSSNMASISGRALCAKAMHGNTSGKPILDTGTTQTMFKDRRHFATYTPRGTSIEVANGDTINGQGVGMIKATHRGESLTFCNSLHVPSLKTDLVSMVELAKKGCSIEFKNDGKFEVVQGSDVVLSGALVDGLMELDIELGGSLSSTQSAMSAKADGVLLHSRLGHPGPVPFSKLYPNVKPPQHCEPCILAKHHRLPYRGKFKVASEKLELLHSDLSGMISPASLSGSRYYFKITDSATSFKFIYILRHKSETLSKFMQFKSLVENQTSHRVKSIVNDNGGEYTSKAFESYLRENGIQMFLTAPHTPQQNPVAEVGNRTTVEKARAMLKLAGLPNTFWAEAVNTAVYLENRTPVASRDYRTPFELWFGYPPKLDHLKVFGCLAYVHIGKERRDGKFADTAKRGVMLGYQESHRNYRIWLLEEKRVVYSHDVVFNETVFPLNGNNSSFHDSDEVDFTDEDMPQPESTASPITVDNNASPAESNLNSSLDDFDPELLIPSSEIADTLVPSGIVEGSSVENSTLSPSNLTQSKAKFDISSDIDVSNILPSRCRRLAKLARKIPAALNVIVPDPTTYHQAINRHDSEDWIAAINRELA